MARPKGIPMSKEQKTKMSILSKGTKNHFYGKKHSIETKEKLKKAWEKRRLKGFSEETKNKIKINNCKYWLGKKRSEESILKRENTRKISGRYRSKSIEQERNKKIGLANKGEKCTFWVDGRSYIRYPRLYGDDWDMIREIVYKRDEYKCQNCGISQEESKLPLDIHHIIPFRISKNNNLINLITLCRKCHMTQEYKIKKYLQLKNEKLMEVKNA